MYTTTFLFLICTSPKFTKILFKSYLKVVVGEMSGLPSFILARPPLKNHLYIRDEITKDPPAKKSVKISIILR